MLAQALVLDRPRGLAGRARACLQLARHLAGGQQLDPVLLQIGEHVLGLLAGELRLLHRGRQRVRRQEPTLVGLGDDALQLVQLSHRCVRGCEQTVKPLVQLASKRPHTTSSARCPAPTSPDLRLRPPIAR